MAGDPILTHTRVQAPGAEPKLWLLVLHGVYGSGRNWGSIARRLVEERPEWGVLLTDLRLHGGSQGFTGPHTLRAAADDVVRLVSELDIELGALLGHSFGGKVALAYTRSHAAGLRQLWVVDSTLEVRTPSGSAWRIIEVVRSLPPEFGSREEMAGALVEHGYPLPLGHWLAMNLERQGDVFRWRLDWEGVEEMLRDYFRTDLWDVVETPPGEVQVHVIKATESDALDAPAVERIEQAARATGRVFLHPVPGGHWINTENPEGVLRLLASQLP